MKILSFIIPSFNSQQYLDKCISSFLDPEVLEKLDIIIVNDGSTDGTVEVAQRYCQQYPDSVRLISQENKGHGGALNTGCAAALGKFLKVIDADDWVETENLKTFVKALEHCDSDVVLTHYHTIDISSGEIKNWKTYPPHYGRNYSFEEIMESWKSFDRCLTFHGITYNTEFYQKYGIRLSEHVFYEDHEFATFPCCHAARITPLDLYLYDYRIGDVQQSVSDTNQLKRVGHTETVLRRFVSEYEKLPERCPGKRYVAMKAQGLLLSYFTTTMLVEPDKKHGRKMAQEMMELFRQQLPETAQMAQKQYGAFLMMNRLHISRRMFDKILHSRIYNRLRGNHDFN